MKKNKDEKSYYQRLVDDYHNEIRFNKFKTLNAFFKETYSERINELFPSNSNPFLNMIPKEDKSKK